MYFRPTPINVAALLVITLAVFAIIMLWKKRYDSNLPLLYYLVALVFANQFDRPFNPNILVGGLIMVLLLRFEFMGSSFTKFIAVMANVGLFLMIGSMVVDLSM
jgi:hypothetical protein